MKATIVSDNYMMMNPVYEPHQLDITPSHRPTSLVRGPSFVQQLRRPPRPPARARLSAAVRPPAARSPLVALHRGGGPPLTSRLSSHPRPGTQLRDSFSLSLVTAMRLMFDTLTGYKPQGNLSSAAWLQRIIFLETVAAIPGMVGGAVRHLQSLRLMRRDNGWIHTLVLEEVRGAPCASSASLRRHATTDDVITALGDRS